MHALARVATVSLDGSVAGPNGEVNWIFRTSGETPASGPSIRAGRPGRNDRGTDRQRVIPTAAVLRSWAEPTVARGNLAEEVARLKEQPGHSLLAHGGARFARSLVASGLVDEYRLVVHPVALGAGQPLFSELRVPLDLKLVSTTAFASGVVAAVYHVA